MMLARARSPAGAPGGLRRAGLAALICAAPGRPQTAALAGATRERPANEN